LCKSATKLDEQSDQNQQNNEMIDVNTKNIEEPIEYVTFTNKLNDTSKMFCITALEDEIEVFTDREDFGRLIDPDNTEYIVNELRERIDFIKMNLSNSTWDKNYYLELINTQLTREEQILKIAKKQHDKDRAELRFSNITLEIGRIKKELNEKIDLMQLKKDIQSAISKYKGDINDVWMELSEKSFTKDDFEDLIINKLHMQ